MTLEEFRATLASPNPPVGIQPALAALWHDAKGDWDKAHQTAQDIHDATGAWVHAYLHRKEGDLGNAAYWYRTAGRAVETASLADEWATIADALLRE